MIGLTAPVRLSLCVALVSTATCKQGSDPGVAAGAKQDAQSDDPPSEAPAAPRREAPPGCFAVELDAWKQALATAGDRSQIAAKLAELGLGLAQVGQEDPNLRANSVRIEEVELDGAAPPERFLAIHLGVSDRGNEQVIAAVLTHADPDFWCPVGAEALTVVQHDNIAPPEVEFELLDWLGDERRVIGQRCEMELNSSDPAGTNNFLTVFELRERELVQIFGPFTLFEAMESSYISDPEITGIVEPRGEFPRELHTVTSTDCTVFRQTCKDNPEPCRDMELSCKPGPEAAVWRYTDGKYRKAEDAKRK